MRLVYSGFESLILWIFKALIPWGTRYGVVKYRSSCVFDALQRKKPQRRQPSGLQFFLLLKGSRFLDGRLVNHRGSQQSEHYHYTKQLFNLWYVLC